MASLSLVLLAYTWSPFEDLCLGLLFPRHRERTFVGLRPSIGACRSALQTFDRTSPSSEVRKKLVVEISLDHTVESGLWDPPPPVCALHVLSRVLAGPGLAHAALTRCLVLS